MKYYSLNKKAPITTFENAVVKGLAPDKGLYFPEKITPLPQSFFDNIDNLSHAEIAFEAIKQFVSPEIPEAEIKRIVEDTLSFDFPIEKLTEQISTLELFHGPTMAFKDVGARFMARCLGYFNKENTNEVKRKGGTLMMRFLLPLRSRNDEGDGMGSLRIFKLSSLSNPKMRFNKIQNIE